MFTGSGPSPMYAETMLKSANHAVANITDFSQTRPILMNVVKAAT